MPRIPDTREVSNHPVIRQRYAVDAEKLRRVADWLDDHGTLNAGTIALDYHRLADTLDQMAKDARELARAFAGQLP